jgi:hypothetical protein
METTLPSPLAAASSMVASISSVVGASCPRQAASTIAVGEVAVAVTSLPGLLSNRPAVAADRQAQSQVLKGRGLGSGGRRGGAVVVVDGGHGLEAGGPERSADLGHHLGLPPAQRRPRRAMPLPKR